MFAVVPDPIPARMRVLNRADVCDANFLDAVRGWRGTPRPAPGAGCADPAGQHAHRRRVWQAVRFAWPAASWT
jgi:hypothetical protein